MLTQTKSLVGLTYARNRAWSSRAKGLAKWTSVEKFKPCLLVLKVELSRLELKIEINGL